MKPIPKSRQGIFSWLFEWDVESKFCIQCAKTSPAIMNMLTMCVSVTHCCLNNYLHWVLAYKYGTMLQNIFPAMHFREQDDIFRTSHKLELTRHFLIKKSPMPQWKSYKSCSDQRFTLSATVCLTNLKPCQQAQTVCLCLWADLVALYDTWIKMACLVFTSRT